MQENIANTQQKRLYTALKSVAGEDVARDIALSDMLPVNPNAARKADWAISVCERMERELDADTVMSARMACHCKPPVSKFAALKRAYARTHDIGAYVASMNAMNESADFWLEGNDIYMRYPRCYCSFVNKADKPLHKAWCACSLGYAKALNDDILMCDTSVELIKSVATGADECVIKISLPEKG